MAKLHFIYATMNAGKSAQLLQTEFNYRERGMSCLLMTAALDTRAGTARITSRLGLAAEAEVFRPDTPLTQTRLRPAIRAGVACILVDEAQFLSAGQVDELCAAVDDFAIPVMAYGLRTDFQGNLFPGSAALMARADELSEMKTICHCNHKATMVLRRDADGRPTLKGDQVQIGGNDTYVALCRRHWLEAHAAAAAAGDAAAG